MATFVLFDFLDNRGGNVIKDFLSRLQKVDLAKINARLTLLANQGDHLYPSILTPAVRSAHVKELVVNGKVAIRLLLCKGPINHRNEFTILMGAFEKDRAYVPKNAVQKAEERREIVITDPSRRIEHEHVGS